MSWPKAGRSTEFFERPPELFGGVPVGIFKERQFPSKGKHVFLGQGGADLCRASGISSIGKEVAREIGDEAVPSVTVAIVVCARPVEAHYETLVFYGPRLQQGAPCGAAGFGPVRYIDREVVRRSAVVPHKHWKAKIIADLQQDAEASEFNFNPVFACLEVVVLSGKRKEVALVVECGCAFGGGWYKPVSVSGQPLLVKTCHASSDCHVELVGPMLHPVECVVGVIGPFYGGPAKPGGKHLWQDDHIAAVPVECGEKGIEVGKVGIGVPPMQVTLKADDVEFSGHGRQRFGAGIRWRHRGCRLLWQCTAGPWGGVAHRRRPKEW